MFSNESTAVQCPPEKIEDGHWVVYNTEGAFQILRNQEYIEFLKNPLTELPFFINCSTFSRIKPTGALWNELSEIAKKYRIMVFPISSNEYVEWTGKSDDNTDFDAMMIYEKKYQYSENFIPPKKIDRQWIVDSEEEMLYVLEANEHQSILDKNRSKIFYVSVNLFGGKALIRRDTALWKKITRIEKYYKVQLFPRGAFNRSDWKDWGGGAGNQHSFDGVEIEKIRVSRKTK